MDHTNDFSNKLTALECSQEKMTLQEELLLLMADRLDLMAMLMAEISDRLSRY